MEGVEINVSDKSECCKILDKIRGTKEKHEIFRRDPATLFNYMYKEVEIICCSKEVFRGRVYTVDPVSYTFVLHDCSSSFNDGPSKKKEMLTLVIGHNIVDVRITNDTVTQETKNAIDSLYSCSQSIGGKTSDPEHISDRKTKLIDWFKENHLTLQPSKNDESILTLNDLVEIKPPYTRDDCFCTNHIVLGKILDLMNKMPH